MAVLESILGAWPQAQKHQAIITFVVIILFPFLLTWIFTSLQSLRAVAVARQAASGNKRPPTLPTIVPFIGHVLRFSRDGHKFLYSAVRHFGRGVPVRVNLATFSSYIVSGQETVSAFLKDPAKGLSQTSRSLNIMTNAFGCPAHLVHLFKARDDQDLEHQIHNALQGMLTGARLETLAGRYQEAVVHQVLDGDARMDDEWTRLPDLCTFVEKNIFEAATRAVFGPYLVELNPTISADFWNFNRHVKSMFMGVPRWLNPASIASRDTMTDHVKRWQRHAQQNCSNIDDIPDDFEWEPYYGSKSTRIRQQLLTKRGILDESARAAENLAFMWATNANSVPAACWFLLETLHNPALKKRVMSELESASVVDESEKRKFKYDIVKLTSNPLLQSVFAEVLRLRVAVLVVRQPTQDHYNLGGWHIKKGETVCLSTRNELLDSDFWNAGTLADPHPVSDFWADRFLLYPNDPSSGPLKEPKRRTGNKDSLVGEEPSFSLDGCTWNWVPFGGGRNLCPGRHFAKREIMLTAAIFLKAYDIELLTDTLPGPDESVFGFGTMPPNAKVPCRIRRRQT
ncbi:Cholesterol 7-alpha-monooxygenase [Cytospora mali]|uniref:Cholesterol 7-alpha-monooxygenase n=1 Tax=Cytospora mali TaxID=578113 RepID=A0A194VDA9_CYTMA|nr:Cholesterol 7-alpha-monooxygenase [Valsa mali var. pyri (nom. inval.)]